MHKIIMHYILSDKETIKRAEEKFSIRIQLKEQFYSVTLN